MHMFPLILMLVYVRVQGWLTLNLTTAPFSSSRVSFFLMRSSEKNRRRCKTTDSHVCIFHLDSCLH